MRDVKTMIAMMEVKSGRLTCGIMITELHDYDYATALDCSCVSLAQKAAVMCLRQGEQLTSSQADLRERGDGYISEGQHCVLCNA